MVKNELLDPISSYIQEIDYLLPYSKKKKEPLLKELRYEVQDALKTDNRSPNLVYGSPYEVAKNVSISRDWGTKPAQWGTRTLAFIIDIVLIVSLCFLYLIFGFVIIFNIDLWQFLTFNELGEVLEQLRHDQGIRSFLIIAFIAILYASGTVIIFSAYFVAFEKIYSGTIGKKILGLQAVDVSGIRLTWKQAIVRNFTKFPGIIEFLIFDIILGMLMNERGQGEYQKATDILAETKVVKNR